jgi:hypothetical protein
MKAKKVFLFDLGFLFVVVFCCGVSIVFGQVETAHREPGKIAFREEAMDSSLLIVDYGKVKFSHVPAFHINGKFYQQSIIASLGLAWEKYSLSSLNIREGDTIVNGELYQGKIYATTLNDEFEIKEISLSDIKKKYTDLKEQSAVFIIDGEIVTRDCDTYLIDENAIYQISIVKIINPETAFVDILTKTEENIKRRNTIHVGKIVWKK